MNKLNPDILARIVAAAIEEDIGAGDITTNSVIEKNRQAKAEIVVEEDCVVAGMPVARLLYEAIDEELDFQKEVEDGKEVQKGTVIARLYGSARTILTGERIALNFLQMLSGIATLTSQFAARTRQFGTKILDTRKTTPGLRYLEKYAVRVGGGSNHRMGLYDMFLIKDNHLRAIGGEKEQSVATCIERAREFNPNVQVEIEVENLQEFEQALKAQPDMILLDNMPVAEINEAVKMAGGEVVLEASGGVTLDTIEEIARTGVDCISIGALTTAARATNMKMELTEWV
ncbi:carboxylating nicotinate-nucleotide diphosphorylase [bacterium]|nr:carboxylating nicotinate-nucleotide diphosphorylase [bacterium]